MTKRWTLKTAILAIVIFLPGPRVSSQSIPAAESLSSHDPAAAASSIVNPDNLQSAQPKIIHNTDLKYLEPTAGERFARSLQYQYQLQEQPAVLVASVGGSTQVIPNPNKWLQQHSIIL